MRFDVPQQQEKAAAAIRSTLKQALDVSYAPATKAVQKTHLAYWYDFCKVAQMSPHTCFSANIFAADTAALAAEANILSAFLAFIVIHPRGKKAHNTAAYALQILSTVRAFFADAISRRPGIALNGASAGNLKAVVTGLRRVSPSPVLRRKPILQFHLRAIRARLQLRTNHLHRVAWALWLTQWQGCLRAGDLLRGKKGGAFAWCPAKDTHRGRVSVGIAHDTGGRVIGAGLTLRLKPTKTDMAGESGAVRTFVLDEDPHALSAAAAIKMMLANDPTDGDKEHVPLLRDTDTGGELAYAKAATLFKRKLTEAGYPELATGLHSLRTGGATAYANDDEGGMLVATSMGGWSSTAYRRYIWSCQERLCAASMAIGRADGLDLADRRFPFSSI